MWVVSHDIYLSLSDLNFTYYDEVQVQSEDFFGLCAFSPQRPQGGANESSD